MKQTFRVWAILPKRVELVLADRRLPMTPGPDGWWETMVDVAPGTDYGFLLDGEGPFPDPRSPWQPHGVHGLSRVVDHGAFAWSDHDFRPPPLASGLVYELHVGTFTPEGTFDSAIGRLDHLVELGVTHVELMPVNEFSGERGWGYDGVDLFAPHHSYGGPDGLKRFVNACHARGLAVLLDVVYNHLGPSGNYLGRFSPYFNDRYHTPWGPAVNFDGPYSDEVRRFFCDNALMWLRDYHFDGLRLDAVHAIFDQSARPFLEQLADEVRELSRTRGRPLLLIPESDLNDPRLLWPRERGGFAHDAQWSDDFHHALHALLTGERKGYYADFGTLAHLAKALRQAYVYDGCYSHYRKRSHGRKPEGLDGSRFLGYAQNHDQVGNRARGERLSQLLNQRRLKIAAALVLTSPFVPLLFQGEEWAASSPFLYFTDHRKPELARAVREGRRREFAAFGWKPEEIPDPQDPDTFAWSKLDWSEIHREGHADLLAWHRQLIRLRRSERALHAGPLDSVQVVFDETEQWLSFTRPPFGIAVNLGASARVVPLPMRARTLVLASDPAVALRDGGVWLPPDSVAILKA
ncbi:malto-oligosyltrehalose trehalohydrolase [Limisphaera sp. 4302-co]|uniref:malto-oligosyltrehalose trehalohydrolase n=1 Tax=Limisphaera sp. 4302-co TaxID=3400417 RepID=UPI003C28899B